MKSIILASASPRRQTLLRQLNLSFIVDPADIEEVTDHHNSPEMHVISLASQKAGVVAARHRNALIIGADTVVVHQGQILEKPLNQDDAYDMLRMLSNTTHDVITGLCLLTSDMNHEITKKQTTAVTTRVSFDTLTDQEIKDYISSGSPMDKAGAYGIQDDWGSLFVNGIEGDFYNVVGFPLNRFYNLLKQHFQEFLPRTATSA